MTKDKAADLRLQRIYGITLPDYDIMFKRQGGVCFICHKPPKPDKRLHVDHDHSVNKLKVVVQKATDGGWYASVIGHNIIVHDVDRKEARLKAKRLAKRKSVRGLLCWQDNAGLQKFRDDPDRLAAAAQYLNEYKTKGNQLG